MFGKKKHENYETAKTVQMSVYTGLTQREMGDAFRGMVRGGLMPAIDQLIDQQVNECLNDAMAHDVDPVDAKCAAAGARAVLELKSLIGEYADVAKQEEVNESLADS